MSITTGNSRIYSAGNGVTTLFPVPFKFMRDGDIKVYTVDTSTFAKTLLVQDVDYTLAIVDPTDDANYGSVTTIVAPPSGTVLAIYRDPAVSQPLDLAATTALPVSGINDELDRLTIIACRALDLAQRAIHADDAFYPNGFSFALPVSMPPNMAVATKADGTGFGLVAIPATFAVMPQFATDNDFEAANGGATAGNTYWNTTLGVPRIYNGSQWFTIPMNGPVVTGSLASPVAITAVGGITLQGVPDETIFLTSAAGDLTLTANPQITAGVRVGDRIRLVWIDPANSITMNPGNGANPNGPWQALGGSSGQWLGWWDGSTWQQDGVT